MMQGDVVTWYDGWYLLLFTKIMGRAKFLPSSPSLCSSLPILNQLWALALWYSWKSCDWMGRAGGGGERKGKEAER